jgi:hypothetical protein
MSSTNELFATKCIVPPLLCESDNNWYPQERCLSDSGAPVMTERSLVN